MRPGHPPPKKLTGQPPPQHSTHGPHPRYVSKALVHVTDIHATLLKVAGVHADPGEIDGVDQWDSIVGAKDSARGSILHNINSELFGNAGALRHGDYKLIVESRVSESEIYSYVGGGVGGGGCDRQPRASAATDHDQHP